MPITLPHEEHAKYYIPKPCPFYQFFAGRNPNSCNIDSSVQDTTIYTGYYYDVDPLKQKTIEEMRQAILAKIPSYKQLDSILVQPGFVQVYIKSQGIPVDLINEILNPTVMGQIVSMNLIEEDWSTFKVKIGFTTEALANSILARVPEVLVYTNPTNHAELAQEACITHENDAFVLTMQFRDDEFDAFTDEIEKLIVNE